MPRFTANLSMLFTENEFLDRIEAASDVGFKGVEYLFPYDHSIEGIVTKLREYKIQQVLFNMPPGNWEQGERGLAALPGREVEFEIGVEKSIEYANALDCEKLHMMAGIPISGTSLQLSKTTYVRNLKMAARACQPHGITVIIEPINLRDMPGYFVHHQNQALDLLDEIGEDNTGLQMDLYHCQITEGDLAKRIEANIDRVSHFQIAGVPQHHEPNLGEINYSYLFDLIDSLGYQGWIGCEYHPKTTTLEGLAWALSYGIAQ